MTTARLFKMVSGKVMLALCLMFILGNGNCGGCDNGDPADPGDGNGSGILSAARIARWDGSQWHALRQGVKNPTPIPPIDFGPASVNGLAVDADTLVLVGGYFWFADNAQANSVASWVTGNNSWQGFGTFEAPGVSGGELAGGANSVDAVYATPFGRTLFVGGDFSTVYNYDDNDQIIELGANNVAMFYLDIGYWDILTTGADAQVNAVKVNSLGLLIGGIFQSAGGVAGTNLIARWDILNSQWASVGGGITGSDVMALAVDLDNWSHMLVGGTFSQAGAVPANNIVRWAGNQWEALGEGLNGTVYDIALSGSDVYAAGQFFTADYLLFNILAKWDGSTWTMLGDQINPAGQEEKYLIRGLALAINGNDLYLGGHFTSMGGVTVNHVARLDLTNGTWSDLTGGVHNIGTGAFSGVRALAISENDVIVGGTFLEVGTSN